MSPILFYDPVERVVATLHPNNTYEKIVFDPWRLTSWDVNDTVLFDPRTDPDVADFFVRLPERDYLPTWYRERIGGALGPAEKAAAEKAARHADTPTAACFDSLGRTFLSIADNGRDESGRARKYLTRTVLDIEGNQRAVIDALDRIVMRYDYDALRRQIHQASMEAGQRWSIADITGKPIRAWNSRLYELRTEYDALRRPIRSFVRGGDPYERNAKTYPRGILFERTVYGDGADTALTEHQRLEANLRGKVYRRFDSAGSVTTDRYDFKGNLLRSRRQFARDYKNIPDWSEDAQLESESFVNGTTYDALNRVVTTTSPDQSVYRPRYNEANLLDKIDVALRGARRDERPLWTPFVRNIEYNARGQRTRIDYANGAATSYAYDDKTFRLVRLETKRSSDRDRFAAQIFADAALVQDLRYVYDPVGNITEIADGSLRTIFHDNHRVDPICRYTYDPLYRLIEATGRENKAQSAFRFNPPNGDYRDYPFVGAGQLGDLQALRNFEELFEYDPVGNFLRMIHKAENGNWTRHYAYDEKSLVEHGSKSNRLSRTHIKTKDNPVLEPYLYDAHGNVIQMPHLPVMQWNFKDQLSASSRQVLNDATPETTYYVYDASGQRARKITEGRNGQKKNERFYVGGFEVYREHASGGGVTLERQTLLVMDGKQRIALVETQTVDGCVAVSSPTPAQRYQLANHLGSACIELDESGGLISWEEYSPYGGPAFQAGRSAAEVSLKRYRYTGKERDEETGLNYHATRYYALWLGRWISPDTVGLSAGLCLYQYSSSNPVRYVDPKGTDDEEYVPSVGGADRQPKGDIPKGHAEVVGRLDLDDALNDNSILRDRVQSVAKELDLDPGILAAALVAEHGTEVWSRTSGHPIDLAALGLDDWFGKTQDQATGQIIQDNNIQRIEKKIIADHPNLGLKFGDVQDNATWWDTSTEKPGGKRKPDIILNDDRKTVAAAGVYFKMQETVLRQAIKNTGSQQDLDDLLPEERLTLLRIAFNGGVGIARGVFLRLVNGGDIPRSGSTERDPKNAPRTAVLHMARGVHLDQAVFGRPSSDYRPTVKTILRREGATITIEKPPSKS